MQWLRFKALLVAARLSSRSPCPSTPTPTSSSTSAAANAVTKCPRCFAISRNWPSRSTERPNPSWGERLSSPTPPTCLSPPERPPSTPASPCPNTSATWATTSPWWPTPRRVGPRPWEKSRVVSPKCPPTPAIPLTSAPGWRRSTNVPAESSVWVIRNARAQSLSSAPSRHPVLHFVSRSTCSEI